MARPTQHYGKWRIRWIDEHGIRRSEVYETLPEAKLAASRREVEASEIRQGLRTGLIPNRTIADLLPISQEGHRKVLAKVGNFMSPIYLLQSSDVLLTCPESLARSYADLANLEVTPLPIRIPPIEIKMVWHERLQADPLQKWLRAEVASISEQTS